MQARLGEMTSSNGSYLISASCYLELIQRGVDEKFTLLSDDSSTFTDGVDSTRAVFRVTDEFGNIRPFAADAIKLNLEAPRKSLVTILSRWSAERVRSGSEQNNNQERCGSRLRIRNWALQRSGWKSLPPQMN